MGDHKETVPDSYSGDNKERPVKENFDAVTVDLTQSEVQEIEEALLHMNIVGMER